MRIIKSVWGWIDDRTGLSATFGPMARHLVPPGTTWLYVFGSATLVAFIIQVVTGVLLATVYVPSAGEAYQSLQFITNQAWLGSFLRGLHYFGASAMVLFIGIHMIRVFLMAAYKYPREMSWLTGVLLLVLTITMGFTGQLLRWDQNAFWSIVVAAEQAGRVPFIGKAVARFILAGDVIGGATLSRFFTFHVFLIPALIFGFVGFHLYLVLRNGISEPPKLGRLLDPKTYRGWYEEHLKRDGHPFWPDAAWRDVVFGVGMLVILVLLAIIVGPPILDKPPDPTIIKAMPRPDWYLLWYFAVLALLPHGLENYVIVLGPLLAGVALLILPLISNKGERHPVRRPWAIAAVLVVVMMISALWVAGKEAPWSPNFDPKPLTTEIIGATSGPVFDGAEVFYKKGCLNCHTISGHGGHRGPNLTTVADRLTENQMIIRIINGGYNMPAFGGNITSAELDQVVAFLQSRKAR